MAQLRTLVRFYIDDRGSSRFTDAELLVFLNEGQKEVQKIIDEADENFFSDCQSYSVVTDTDSYEFGLPDNLKKVIQVERLVSGGTPVPAEYVEFRKRHDYPAIRHELNYFGIVKTAPMYYLRGLKIGIANPTESYTLRLWYTYAIPDLVNDADRSEIPPEYRNLIALSAVPLTKGERIGGANAMPDELVTELKEGMDKLRLFIETRQRQTARQVNYQRED